MNNNVLLLQLRQQQRTHPSHHHCTVSMNSRDKMQRSLPKLSKRWTTTHNPFKRNKNKNWNKNKNCNTKYSQFVSKVHNQTVKLVKVKCLNYRAVSRSSLKAMKNYPQHYRIGAAKKGNYSYGACDCWHGWNLVMTKWRNPDHQAWLGWLTAANTCQKCALFPSNTTNAWECKMLLPNTPKVISLQSRIWATE